MQYIKYLLVKNLLHTTYYILHKMYYIKRITYLYGLYQTLTQLKTNDIHLCVYADVHPEKHSY